ncbi:MAG TPA: hypothetical protein VFV83_10185, partial [Chthoniobacteraceae bacterium]|nr:hypothetical protein [Chthoniobacteraceae bacterium]
GNNARSGDEEREEAADFEVVLHSALAITDDTDRNVRLRDIARSIDIADLPAAAERAKRLGSIERWQVQQALGARWAESDPKGAAAFALKSGGTRWGSDPLLNAVLDKWATTDLPSVTTWLGELPAGKRSNLTASLVTSLARREPESALRLVESQPGAQQNYWLYRQIFEQWAQRDPALASVAAQNLKSGTSRDQAIQAVVAGWTNDNPEAAIAWTKTFEDQATRAKLLNTVAGTWAEVDAKATLAWTRTIEDPRLRQQLFNSTLARIAVNDTTAAQNELRSLPAGQERDNAVNQVMSTVAQQDTKGAFGFLDLLPEGHAREVATANLVSQMARVDPQAAGERLLTLPVAQVTDLAGRIASVMATENLQTAIEWTRNLPEGQARKNAMNGICSAWAQYAPREAAEWMLKEQPGADISSVVGTWAANAPNDVLAWARTLTDGDTKRGAMTMVVQALTANNAAEARSVFSRDLTPEAQAAAAPQLAQALAKRDLAATRAWAETLPQGPARDGALAGVVREWADQDARAAAGWIEKIPAGESRDMVVTQFATTVMRRDPESAIAWAASISEPELRSTQLEQLANRWMQSDAGAARQWVNQSNILSEAAKHRVLNQRPVRGNYYYTAYGQFFE